MLDIEPLGAVGAPTSTQAFSVSEINALIADLLASGLPSFLWIEGEVSNLSVAASGHRYLSLKDANSTISCALFRSSANRISKQVLGPLKNGDKVIVKANLSVYKPRGHYQLIISDIEPSGFGALARAFAELKTKLEAAGLTAQTRKREVPAWPKGIGVVTSGTGAAVEDVLTTLNRRAPFIPIRVYPTVVQGAQAPQQIVDALARANDDSQIEVILLVRGGGALEDLMAFNSESVAMAVAQSHQPVVTGVGHETDVTIVDFVSDYRAPTPTAAAEIVSPDKHALTGTLAEQLARLIRATTARSDGLQKQLNVIAKRLRVQHPYRLLQQQSQRLDELSGRLQYLVLARVKQHKEGLGHHRLRLWSKSPTKGVVDARDHLEVRQKRLQQIIKQQASRQNQRLATANRQLLAFEQRFSRYQQQMKGLAARLQLLSPLGVLARGYSLSFDASGQLIRSAKALNIDDEVSIRFSDGHVKAVVKKKN